MQKQTELCKIFKEPPVLAFRKPKSLKDILVRADISPRFPKPFFGGLFVGADAFDSESLAVRNTFGAMFRMTILWGQVLMFICRFVINKASGIDRKEI
jgi:hypothetical protein